MDHRMYTDEEYRKAMERCIECEERMECELFLGMNNGGQAVKFCPKGKANVL